MDDANKALRIASHLKSIRSSDTVQYELLSRKAMHKFSQATRRIMQTVYISTDYLSDHKLSTIISDMNIRHVAETMKSNDNPKEFFLGYTSSGKVVFSVMGYEKSFSSLGSIT